MNFHAFKKLTFQKLLYLQIPIKQGMCKNGYSSRLSTYTKFRAAVQC